MNKRDIQMCPRQKNQVDCQNFVIGNAGFMDEVNLFISRKWSF